MFDHTHTHTFTPPPSSRRRPSMDEPDRHVLRGQGRVALLGLLAVLGERGGGAARERARLTECRCPWNGTNLLRVSSSDLYMSSLNI